MILLKTGNVLSDGGILLLIISKLIKTPIKARKLINIAFRQGFNKLNKKILLDKDYSKINISTKNQNLISHYQIVDNTEEKNEFIKINIF